MRDVKNPIVLDPFYTNATGDLLPVYEDILLQNVHDLSPGKLTLVGLDAQHLLKVHLDGVYIDGVRGGQIKAEHARFWIGPNGTNLKLQGTDIEVRSQANQDKPLSCKDAFLPFPSKPVVNPQTQSATDLYPDQPA